MLGAHAASPHFLLDVASLARAAGHAAPNYTYSQYGRLGHDLALELNHEEEEGAWTRLLGTDSRDPVTGLVQWELHENLAKAVKALQWTAGDVITSTSRDIYAAFDELNDLESTTRNAIVQARLGQGTFRAQLISYWGRCAVTGCETLEALIASHIKPWRDCSNAERLDPHNGLLLLGTLDRLFDAGLITFDDSGVLVVSTRLPRTEVRTLGVHRELRLTRVERAHLPYLAWHRERVFSSAMSKGEQLR
jgi:hypothetical protein